MASNKTKKNGNTTPAPVAATGPLSPDLSTPEGIEAALAAAKEMVAKAREAKRALRGPVFSAKCANPGKAFDAAKSVVQPETAALFEAFAKRFDGRKVPTIDDVIQAGMGRIVAMDNAKQKRAEKQ